MQYDFFKANTNSKEMILFWHFLKSLLWLWIISLLLNDMQVSLQDVIGV